MMQLKDVSFFQENNLKTSEEHCGFKQKFSVFSVIRKLKVSHFHVVLGEFLYVVVGGAFNQRCVNNARVELFNEAVC
jgi:predicted DNA-binding protein with PD1-like motif